MDDDGLLTEDFKRMVKADEDESRQLIGELLRRKYPDVVQLGTTNATQLQLEEAFDATGVEGETRRKAIAFYLKAAAHAGIATSKQWTVPRVTAGRARRKKPPAGVSQGGTTTPPAATSVEGHRQTVNLGSGGTVAVAVSVNLWDLDGDDLT
jgi:hypothetical protein